MSQDQGPAAAEAAARARLKPQARALVDAITDTLRAHTGHDYRLEDAEQHNDLPDGGGALRLLAVWGCGAGAPRYVLSARRVRVGVYHASVGARRGAGSEEARLDVRLHGWGLRALLDDPAHVVGLMLGQRAGFFRGVAGGPGR